MSAVPPAAPAPAHDSHATPAAAGEKHDFIRQIVREDLASGKHAVIHTRFPPEPNGYLHIGHAKSICLNFGLAQEFGGECNLRFDDTNPAKEDQEYIDAIKADVEWLGFKWAGEERYASNYIDQLHAWAIELIKAGKAFVCDLNAEEMREYRGSLTEPGKNSPFRERSVEENLDLFARMKAGEFPDGARSLRAKIDMASPNINLRDPILYRIRHAHHHQTGDKWCIYPSYDFTHGQSDAIEGITHSICTLEFEDHRPLYEWFLANLPVPAQPRQYEFARLNLNYTITSKRKLKQLVDEGTVAGWDDPRMPTIVGLRRRGYTPESLQLFAERIGVTKSDSWIDYSTLDIALRDDLESKAHRGMVVLDPVKLTLTNWDEVMGAGHLEPCSLPALPHVAEGRTPPPAREFTIGREVWIEREDFAEVPPKGYKRLFPGNKVRLKGGFVVECTGCEKDADGRVTAVLATVVPDTKSGTPGADAVKVKAAITWVGVADGVAAEVRLYDRLFTDAHPDAGGKDFKASLNPDSCRVITAYVEPSLAQAVPDQKFQFERHGYFVADRQDHAPGRPVFNRITGLKDSWGK